MRVLDLRSDTVTLPPPEMRRAISEAEVGDDVYGEDPSVNRLESLAAERLGKPAGVFVPSGTMANLAAVLAHCPRESKVLLGDRSDLWLWEAGGPSVLGGVLCHPVPTQSNGELALADLEAAFGDESDAQCARVGLFCLETTHGMCGGFPLSLGYLARVRGFARRLGLPVHLDGARIFNAALALGVDAARVAEHADSVSFCLSKGLAAPVGSLVVGEASLMDRVRRLRKLLGGGMRQAGFLAAAGSFALEHMVDRLAEDHLHARLLADGLKTVPGLVLEADSPPTNIVFWRLAEPGADVAAFIAALAERGVRVMELGRGRIRAVTHYGIGREDVERAVDAVARTLGAAAGGRAAL